MYFIFFIIIRRSSMDFYLWTVCSIKKKKKKFAWLLCYSTDIVEMYSRLKKKKR